MEKQLRCTTTLRGLFTDKLMKERDGDTETESDKEKGKAQHLARLKLTTSMSQGILATGVVQLLPSYTEFIKA